MAAQVCPKARGILSVAGGELKVSVAGGLELLATEQNAGGHVRQQIIDLYDSLRTPLKAYLCCLGMSPDQAEDVIQETFLRLVRERTDRGDENLRAWVFRVAHNLSMDVHRFQRRWARGDDDTVHYAIRRRPDPAPSPEQRVILEERMKRFQDAFAQLTPKQRQCVLLRVEGFRYIEIAQVLGISVQRVGELMSRSIIVLGTHTS